MDKTLQMLFQGNTPEQGSQGIVVIMTAEAEITEGDINKAFKISKNNKPVEIWRRKTRINYIIRERRRNSELNLSCMSPIFKRGDKILTNN